MKTIRNKTHRPLRVPLPQGKVLHLGPGKSGQIGDHAEAHPALKRLVDAGEIEVLDASAPAQTAGEEDAPGQASPRGHAPRTSVPSRGDRSG